MNFISTVFKLDTLNKNYIVSNEFFYPCTLFWNKHSLSTHLSLYSWTVILNIFHMCLIVLSGSYFYHVSKCFESTVHWKALVVHLCCRTGISLSIVRLHKYLCWWMLYSFQTSLLVALVLLMHWKQDIFQISPKHTTYNIH